MRSTLKRRTLLLAGAAALVAGPAVEFVRRSGFDRDRRRSYEALVEALLAHGTLPDPMSTAPAAGDRLDALYRDALPARRREIDAVLDALADARVARLDTSERVDLLRRWGAAGGERRALAARVLALAAATYGPADDRALPVAI